MTDGGAVSHVEGESGLSGLGRRRRCRRGRPFVKGNLESRKRGRAKLGTTAITCELGIAAPTTPEELDLARCAVRHKRGVIRSLEVYFGPQGPLADTLVTFAALRWMGAQRLYRLAAVHPDLATLRVACACAAAAERHVRAALYVAAKLGGNTEPTERDLTDVEEICQQAIAEAEEKNAARRALRVQREQARVVVEAAELDARPG